MQGERTDNSHCAGLMLAPAHSLFCPPAHALQGRLLLAARSGRLRGLRIPDASLNVTALLMEQVSCQSSIWFCNDGQKPHADSSCSAAPANHPAVQRSNQTGASTAAGQHSCNSF